MSSIKYRNSANDTWQELQVIIGPQGPAGATGATGPAGATGATGPQGPAGANGADGNGIASIVLNNDYTLTITYTDGTSTTTGSIRGPQGAQGSTGPAGTYTAGTGIDITNNEISVDATDLSYNDLQNKPIIPTVPTNVSAFTNDAGYLTAHQSLTGYATETYVNQAIAQVPAGTTYTAGTGISISNGVISLALANASQEAM